MNATRPRLEYISNLRIIACVLVILVHVSMHWRTATLGLEAVVGSLARSCVPLFLMITGALALKKIEGIKAFTARWMSRILLPFVFYAIIYQLYFLYVEPRQWNTDAGTLLTTFLKSLLGGEVCFHFWYVYMIAGAYLMMPLIGGWIAQASRRHIEYFLLVWIAWSLAGTTHLMGWKMDANLFGILGYMGYVVLGYYLSKFDLPRPALTGFALTLIGWTSTALLTAQFSKMNGEFVHRWYDYTSPNVIVLSAGMFVFVRAIDLRITGLAGKFRDELSHCSYGIYLLHWIVLLALQRFVFDWQKVNPWISMPLSTFIAMIISFAIVIVLSKIPFVRKISGR